MPFSSQSRNRGLLRSLQIAALTALCCLSSGIATAQSASSNASYNFRFSLIALAPEKVTTGGLDEAVDLTLTGVSYETGGVVRPLEAIPFQSRSPSYLYRGGGPLAFFRQEAGADGEVIRKTLAEIKVNPRWRSVIIFARPTEQGGQSGFDADVIEDDPRAFPENSVMLVNRSHQPVTIELEGSRHAVEAGAQLRLPISLQQAKVVPLRLLGPGGTGEKALYSTAIPFHPGQRAIILIRHDPQRGVKVPPLFIFDNPGQTRFDPFDPAKKTTNTPD